MGSGHRQDVVPEPAASELHLAPLAVSSPSLPGAQVGSVTISFEAVYRAHFKTVARWALRLLGPGGDFEDVVQDVFLVVRRKLPQFRGEAEITTWLYEITVRVVQDRRKQARWWSWVTGRGQNPSRGRMRLEFWTSPESPPDPQVLFEARERTRILYQLLDELGEAYRTTFILFELEGISGERIAEITGTRVSTVWTRLSRARRKFIRQLRAWEAKERP